MTKANPEISLTIFEASPSVLVLKLLLKVCGSSLLVGFRGTLVDCEMFKP